MSRVSVAEHLNLSMFVARGMLRKLVGRATAHPARPSAVCHQQDRPPGDLAAGFAHFRRDPGERDLCRPFRVRRQGRGLRRRLAVRGNAAVRRLGRGAARVSAGCATCGPPIPASPAPMRARWSTNGSRWRAATTPSPGVPKCMARRIISWLTQATLVLDDSDVRFYRRFMRSLTRQVRHLRRTVIRCARRRAATAGRDRAHLCGTLHGRPGAAHQRRDQAPVGGAAAADPARRRPYQPQSRRAGRTPGRSPAAAPGVQRAQHSAAASVAQRHRPA